VLTNITYRTSVLSTRYIGYGDTGSDLKSPHGLAYFGGKLLVANMDSKRITRFNDDGS
jgi:hypothetical protein